MDLLLVFSIGLFLTQATLFWWLIERKWDRWLRVVASLTVIGLVPSVMYVEGLHREFGDGGGVNAVLTFMAVVGGFLTLMAVIIIRSIIGQFSQS
jgi:hypothetical protein